MFITFTEKYEHFVDNIQNGFLLNEHKIEFLPSTTELVSSLVDFWDEYRISGDPYTYIRELKGKHGGLNKSFWDELVARMKSDFMFNASLSLVLGQFKSAPIKMKCFTEIRGNQKIDPSHTGYFGKFGILMRENWLLRNGGCPVFYVSGSTQLTNILARNLSIMQTLDACVKSLAKIKSLSVHGAFFDFVSFVETDEHRYEYEWRIASDHKLGGYSILPNKDRATFNLSEVHSFYVPDEPSKDKTILFLKSIEPDSAKIPTVFLTEEILLSDSEVEQIKKIQSRALP